MHTDLFRMLPVSAIVIAFSIWHGNAIAQEFKHSQTFSTDSAIIEQVANDAIFPTFASNSVINGPNLMASNIQTPRAIRVLIKRHSSTLPLFRLQSDTQAGFSASLSSSALSIKYQDRSNTNRPGFSLSSTLIQPIPDTIKHILLTTYIFPKKQGVHDGLNKIIITANTASIQGLDISIGKSIAPPIETNLTISGMADLQDRPLSVQFPANNQASLAFLEQRALGETHRLKRSVTDDITYCIASLGQWCLERLFGATAVNDPATAPVHIAQLTPQPFVGANLIVYEAEEIPSGDMPDFDAAMGMQYCADSSPVQPGNGPEHCETEDRRMISAIGELSVNAIRGLQGEIEQYNVEQGHGATPLPSLQTSDVALTAWLRADLTRAANALSAAQNIASVSDSRNQPNQPVNLRKKKSKTLKSSCVYQDTKQETQNPAWTCVDHAKKKYNRTTPTVALPPNQQTGGRYFLRTRLQDEGQRNQLVREVESRGTLPGGLNAANGSFRNSIEGIARDGFSGPGNLNIVYLNYAGRINRETRFPYGISHIWELGAGGGDNAGHRDDWRQLGINDTSELTRVIMSALTDTHASVNQDRGRNGNLVRTYQSFTYIDSQRNRFTFRNIRIVLGQNGVVITAYPLRNSKKLLAHQEM